ncbi:GL11090 [Drosophila persimilis]|uniref:Uncharacterized protein isoform X1 n=2 Tax=pseudoobscura subgroup TaxID=32358 RepID=A0A6I8VVD0_DROPS|nr:uncharacterized protein LOC6590005 [Drosophila persimilis]XP_033235037.1 uncharacterized protein LOC6898058 isoform X1 [Drosophila pseudoobscura]EDW31348.1 GL11090 [Drosophila persimilis]
MMELEKLQSGDPCRECLDLGLDHRLRYFYISLEEQLLKCESRSCLWPQNDEVSSDEEFDFGETVPIEAPQNENTAAPDEADEFILQLLQDLGSGVEPAAVETQPASDLNLISMPDLLSGPLTEPEACTGLDFSWLEPSIPDKSEFPNRVITKEEIPQLPKTLQTAPMLSPNTDTFNTAPILSPRARPRSDPFCTPLPKASTLPRKEANLNPVPLKTASTQARITEKEILSKDNPFLDAIKRHDVTPTRSSKTTRRRPVVRTGTGTALRTQAVMQLLKHRQEQAVGADSEVKRPPQL